MEYTEMQFKIDNLANQCIQQIKEKMENLNKMNIIVAGKTGSGKSTLINNVFREEVAKVGIGQPVTQHIRRISKKGFPLNVYDTRGFELGKDAQETAMNEIMQVIKQGNKSGDINERIHCIWYCVNTAANKFEPKEVEWIRSFTDEDSAVQVPIIIVLTQSFSKNKGRELKNQILQENLNVKQVVQVLAEDYEIDGLGTAKAYGLDELIRVMSEVLPRELQYTLQNVQKVSLEEKIKHSRAIVATTVTASFGTGFAPIPFADAGLLVPIQVGMIASITTVFGFNIDKAVLTAFASSALGTGGATITGKTIVANIFKLIPGAGTILGGMISGGTAGVLTMALGEAYIQLMVAMYKGEINKSSIETKAGEEYIKKLTKKAMNTKTQKGIWGLGKNKK